MPNAMPKPAASDRRLTTVETAIFLCPNKPRGDYFCTKAGYFARGMWSPICPFPPWLALARRERGALP